MKPHLLFRPRLAALAFSLLIIPAAQSQTSLEDTPLFAGANIPGNVLLTLSVEYPTAIDVANFYAYNQGTTSTSSTTAPSLPFLGYFNPQTCYTYNTTDTTYGPYFQPTSTATDSNYACTSSIVVTYQATYKSASSKSGGTYPYSLNSTSSPTVNTTASTLYWSGNFLNWAAMQTIDPFRSVLTGGYRSVDLGAGQTRGPLTILEKAYASAQGDQSDFPDRTLNSAGTVSPSVNLTSPPTNIGGSSTANNTTTQTVSTTFTTKGPMPFPTQSMALSILSLGNKMNFTYGGSGGGNVDSTTATPYDPTNSSIYVGDSTINSSGSAVANSGVFSVQIRVKVCDPTVGIESNCTKYTDSTGTVVTYKPTGLMQQYANNMRFGVFGYLNDGNIKRDGGVLRAKMNYVGPTYPTPGGGQSATNTVAEWNSSDGTYITNPDSNDANAASTYFGLTGSNVISNSGAINYINKFGETAQSYKAYDPVSELYYAGVRYFEHLGNVENYSSPTATISSPSTSQKVTYADGFPVIDSWDDPILGSCQNNFILGIGDVNTHADGNLPLNSTFLGATSANSSNEPTLETEIKNDSFNDTNTSTTNVGGMEGISNLNKKNGPSRGGSSPNYNETGTNTDGSGYGMAGLAYFTHVNNIRTDLSTTTASTISTYWLDVQEYQAYKYQSQFWLAAKYGGFKVPSGWSYTANTGTGNAPPLSTWNTGGRKDTGFPNVTTANYLPDNYFSAGRPDLLESGLQTAFKNIASSNPQTTTAFAFATAQLTSTGNTNYYVTYDPNTWTGDVYATTNLSINSTTGAVTQSAPVWDAQATLDSTISGTGYSSSRYIATMNSAGQSTGTNVAVPFLYASLNATNQTALQNETTFVDYLRGSSANEGANGTQAYRSRTHVLGDIVNSHLRVVPAPNSPYTNGNNPGYSTFSSNNSSRITALYVGGNDGMLHAFNGSTASGSNGNELFAYVPSVLYQGPTSTPTVNGLVSRGTPVPGFAHHNFVDASPISGDVDLANTADGSGNKPSTTYTPNWHTMLVGGLGKGGMDYYALDITSPGSISSDSSVASNVLWEFSNAAFTSGSPLGYSFGSPVLVKTKKSGWVVLVTSGYNNSDGNGYLFVVNAKTGALIAQIEASSSGNSATSQSGLGSVSAFVQDFTDGTTDYAYAGDLKGNLWRFDLTNASGNYPSSATLLATLTDANSNSQPITAAPLVEIDPATKSRYVLIGTGRLLDSSDIVTGTAQESYYAIIDGNISAVSAAATPITRSNLQSVTSTLTGITPDSTKMGWYIDLPTSATTDPITGAAQTIAYRVTSSGSENFGVVTFAASLPSTSLCNPTGSSRVYAVALSTAKTALNNIAYQDYNGQNNGIEIVNVGGTNLILVGTSISSTTGTNSSLSGLLCPGCNTLAEPQFLNWREVDTSQ